MLNCTLSILKDKKSIWQSICETLCTHHDQMLLPQRVFLSLVCSQLARNFWKFLRAPKFKCASHIFTCQVSVLAERSEISHTEKEAARWWKRKKRFSCHLWKSPLHWRTIIKIKNCRSVWRWNRMLSLSSIWAQFCVMPSWDSLCIFITRGGGKVSAETQLPCSNFSEVTSFPPICRCMGGNTCRMSWPKLLSGQCLLIQLAPLMKYTMLLTVADG